MVWSGVISNPHTNDSNENRNTKQYWYDYKSIHKS